jgi:uncharacterized protein (DUF697 family)
MRIHETVAALLADPSDLTGLFAASTTSELEPIVAAIREEGDGVLARSERYQSVRGNHAAYPDLLALAVNEIAARVAAAHPEPGVSQWRFVTLAPEKFIPPSLNLTAGAIAELGSAAPAPLEAETCDLRLIEILQERAGRRSLSASRLLARAGAKSGEPLSAVVRLAAHIACLRAKKLRRLRRWNWLLRLTGHGEMVPLKPLAPSAPPPPPLTPVLVKPAGSQTTTLTPVDNTMVTPAVINTALRAFANKLPLALWEEKLKEARLSLGRFNIIVAGRTGVGKTTLIGAVFGEAVGDTMMGLPRTRGRAWYPAEPAPDDILRLCDTEGLEMDRYQETLDGLRQEIAQRQGSRDAFDHIHAAWLAIDEPSLTVQPGEIALTKLLHDQGIPVIAVLTKAGMAPAFKGKVAELLPLSQAVIRVRASPIEIEGMTFPVMGLQELIEATSKVIPTSVEKAWAVASHNLAEMAATSRKIVLSAATAAGAAGATPIPIADAAGVFGVQAGMIVGVSLQMGVQLKRDDLRVMAVTLLGALGATAGGRFLAGQVIKLIPGLGMIAGAAITGVTAATLTYGLGHAYIEYLKSFYESNRRMPAPDELLTGFQDFWARWKDKEEAPPTA